MNLEEIKDSFTISVNKVKYPVSFRITDKGVILVDGFSDYSEDVQNKIFRRIKQKYVDEIDYRQNLTIREVPFEEELIEPLLENESEIEKDSENENDTLLEKGTFIENDSKINNDTQIKNDILKQMELKFLTLQKQFEELEKRNQELENRAKGGRPSIGKTRKVSLNLPTDTWASVDDLVAIQGEKGKLASVLRDLILDGFKYRRMRR